MKKVELKVKERQSFGSSESRRLRQSGWIPGVLYGGGNSSVPLAVEAKSLKKALGREGGSAIISLTFEGKKKEHPVILKEYQNDPVGRGLLHVDFMEVRMDQPVEATVRLELVGSAAGVREGGVLDHSLRELHIRCLPGDIPEGVHYDVEQMQIGDSVKVGDIPIPPRVEILNDPDSQVASVIPPTIVKEEAAAEEAEEEAAAEEGAEAEEAPAAEGGAET